VLTEHIKAQIRTYSASESPKEACGLIIVSENTEVFVPVLNISESPKRTFIIPSSEYLRVNKLGEIKVVVHSHTQDSLGPSDADKASCNAGNTPWVVYNLVNDKFYTLYPSNIKPELIGRSFCWGIFDCFTLIRDYYDQVHGLDVSVDLEYEERFWLKGKNYYLDLYESRGFGVVDKPKIGDLLLIQIRSAVPNHAAIYVGGNMILHHLENKLSCRDVYGSSWQKATMLILRHKDLI
jgi:proteasome lid subunit RPN8/RPN11